MALIRRTDRMTDVRTSASLPDERLETHTTTMNVTENRNSTITQTGFVTVCIMSSGRIPYPNSIYQQEGERNET
jgi:hypothetical protein